MQGLVLKNGFRPENEASGTHPAFDGFRASAKASAPAGMASDLRFLSPNRHRHQQLRTGSCVSNSTIRGLEIKRVQKFYDESMASGKSHADALQTALGKHVDLSRLALYYMAREMMDPPETDKDEGTYISLAAEALKRFGVCTEAEWPFNESKLYVPPTWMAMRTAYVHKISTWCKIYSQGQDRVEDVILSLAVGNPVVYGTIVDDRWMGYSGKQPLGPVSGTTRGSHATLLVGWDPGKGVFLGENSWGPFWGQDGFYEVLPEVIASDDSKDFVILYGGWETK